MIKLSRLASILLLTIASVFVTPTTAALADDSSEYPSCTNYVGTGVGNWYGGGFYEGSGDWYAYGPIWYTHTSSACEDISIYWQYNDQWRWRVRFYPSSGGSYVNSWKNSCGNLCTVVVATDVLNGTNFRIEGHKLGAGGVQQVYNRAFDIYF